MDDEPVARILGHGLFGLGIGLTIFSLVYLVLMRARVAQPETTTWLLILLGIVLIPTLVGAAIGAARGREQTTPAPY